MKRVIKEKNCGVNFNRLLLECFVTCVTTFSGTLLLTFTVALEIAVPWFFAKIMYMYSSICIMPITLQYKIIISLADFSFQACLSLMSTRKEIISYFQRQYNCDKWNTCGRFIFILVPFLLLLSTDLLWCKQCRWAL